MLFEGEVNGLPVRALYFDDDVENVFLPLLKMWTEAQKKKDGHYIVYLAAPPAAGKSTFARFLEALSERTDGVSKLRALGMDGFHMYRSTLSERTTVIEGETVCLSKIKGAPETFDLPKLTCALQRLAEGKQACWPLYDRKLHDPVEDAVPVDRDILLLEGNYLLLDRPGWRELLQYADDTVFLEADEDELKTRLIKRKMAGGLSLEEAAKFVAYSDLKNVREVLEHSLPAGHKICKACTDLHIDSV